MTNKVEPVDFKDPESAKTAVEVDFPEYMSKEVRAVWRYFRDSGIRHAFIYKGQIVITNASLCLTWNGYCGPRLIANSWYEVEKTFSGIYDDLVDSGNMPDEYKVTTDYSSLF